MPVFKNGKAMAKQQAGPAPDQINMIGEGTVVEGTIRAESDIRVSGRVEGHLHVHGKAIITQEGSVDGELTAVNADVAGHVQGEMRIEERLVLKGSARVEGTVRAGRLVVEEGAMLDGDCSMGADAAGKRAQLPPAPERAEAPKQKA